QSFGRGNGGAVCNITMLETPQGAAVVDTGGTSRYGAALRALADQRLGGVVATVKTHHHRDHWVGDQACAARPVHALPVWQRARAPGAQALAGGLYRILGSWMNGTAPVPADTAAGEGGIEFGTRRLTVMAMAGHTQGDLVLIDQQT